MAGLNIGTGGSTSTGESPFFIWEIELLSHNLTVILNILSFQRPLIFKIIIQIHAKYLKKENVGRQNCPVMVVSEQQKLRKNKKFQPQRKKVKKSARMQKWKNASMQVCKYASM